MRQTRFHTALLCVLPILAGALPAQGQQVLERVTDPFWEALHPAARISGARFVGFVAARPDTPVVAPVQFSAWIPGDWKGREICLKLMSADGLYESANDYRVEAGWTGGMGIFTYPTRELDALRKRPAQEIAVSVTNAKCDQAATEASLAFWGAAPAAGGMLQVNTFRADETLLILRSGERAQTMACEPIQARVRTAFDTRCAIADGADEQGALDVGIVSVKNGEMGREFTLRLRHAPGQ